MASLKHEKPVGTQVTGQNKKEASKVSTEGAPKACCSKSAPKTTAQKPQEPKKKGSNGGKPAAKN